MTRSPSNLSLSALLNRVSSLGRSEPFAGLNGSSKGPQRGPLKWIYTMTYIAVSHDVALLASIFPTLPLIRPAGFSFFSFFFNTPNLILPLGLCTGCSLCLEHDSLDLSQFSGVSGIASQMPGT